MDTGFLSSQNSLSDINFLEQNFSQLSTEGQFHLKDYLQSLVSLQNAITGTKFEDNVRISSNENRDVN